MPKNLLYMISYFLPKINVKNRTFITVFIRKGLRRRPETQVIDERKSEGKSFASPANGGAERTEGNYWRNGRKASAERTEIISVPVKNV